MRYRFRTGKIPDECLNTRRRAVLLHPIKNNKFTWAKISDECLNTRRGGVLLRPNKNKKIRRSNRPT